MEGLEKGLAEVPLVCTLVCKKKVFVKKKSIKVFVILKKFGWAGAIAQQ